jgi:pyruvate,water dikinase
VEHSGSSPAPTTLTTGRLGSICVVIADIGDVRSMNSCSPLINGVESYFIREEFLSLSSGLSPVEALSQGPAAAAAYGTAIGASLSAMLGEVPSGQRVVMRLLDLRSDDAALIATDDATVAAEPNPELGLHGARWLVRNDRYPLAFGALLAHVRENNGPDAERVSFAVPFINDVQEYELVKRHLGLPSGFPLSVFVETPAAVHSTAAFCSAGVSEIFVGTKDIVQFYLAADRGNHLVTSSYQTRHPAVMDGLDRVIRAGTASGVPVFVFGLGADVEYYAARLSKPTGFMMCTAELQHLSGPAQ